MGDSDHSPIPEMGGARMSHCDGLARDALIAASQSSPDWTDTIANAEATMKLWDEDNGLSDGYVGAILYVRLRECVALLSAASSARTTENRSEA